MASIEIQIDTDKGQFLLSGDTSTLWATRRARFFLTDYLNANFAPDASIAISFQKDKENDKEKVLTQIQETLEKYGFASSLTLEAQQVVNDYLRENEGFTEFSDKARRIWNNDLDADDFKHFTSILRERMPNRTLYDLQLLAAYHLAFSQNACNFSVPGSGKTSIVYAAYTYLNSLPKNDKKYVNKLLIIGPLSSFGPWEDEYEACFGEEADTRRLFAGVPREERVRHFLSTDSAEITLMTYHGVSSSLNDLIPFLRRHENRVMVVLDEAHRIKNTDGGVWAQSVLSIAKYCKSRVILTGTPAPNGYEDIYNLYNFIWPDKDIIGFHLHQLKEMSVNFRDERIPALVENIYPFFIRITKKHLKTLKRLPEAIDLQPTYVEMGSVQRKIYDLIEGSYMDYFEQTNNGQSFKNALVKARMIRLLQAATNPGLLKRPLEEYYADHDIPNDLFIDDSELIDQILRYNELEIPAKFIKVREKVTELIAKGRKVVIWGLFIQTIKQLQKYLESEGLASRLLIGEVPVDLDASTDDIETRERIIREFNSDQSSFNVIIANPSAVAESISLHKTCHDAIYLERNFNAANFLQSKDRIHRITLRPEDKVYYHYILSRDSIDETIHRRLIEKEQSMLAIIESKGIPFIDLNMDYETESTEDPAEDIKALIRDYVRRTAKA